MRTTRLLSLLAALVAVLVLAAACGSDDSDDSGDDSLETISAGALTVCTDAPYPPFEFEQDGEFTGFDMDLVREIATRLDLDLRVTVQPFDGIWLAPAAGKCDLVASAMTITEERQEAALFSEPYFDANQSLLVRATDAGTLDDLEALAGKTIGVQTGTTGEDYAEENAPDGATVRNFDEPAALFLALQSNQIDAVLQDFPVNLERANRDDAFAVAAEFETGEQYGFAAAKDDADLIDAINSELAAARDDGTYDEVFEKYFAES